MGNRSFVIAGDHAELIANDISDFRYRATSHALPVGAQVAAEANPLAETQFMVEAGLVLFMVGGAEWMVMAGDFVRVPAGATYAYRNAGDGPAVVLSKSVSPAPARRALRLCGFAA